jgi:hypothetical protein
MDSAVCKESPASGEQVSSHVRNSDDRDLARALCGEHLRASALTLRRGTLPLRLDIPIRRTRLRTQSTRILPRLALPPHRNPLVVGKDAREGIGKGETKEQQERSIGCPSPPPCRAGSDYLMIREIMLLFGML